MDFTGIVGTDRDTTLPTQDLAAWLPVIGGAKVPFNLGCKVDVEAGSRWESPSQRGKTPTRTFLSKELAKISIKMYALKKNTESNQVALLYGWIDKFVRAKNTGAIVSIEHPLTIAVGAKSMTIKNIAGSYNSSEQRVEFDIDCEEWAPSPIVSTEKTPENKDVVIDSPTINYEKPSAEAYAKAIPVGYGQ
jgi:hypothetical protein